MVLMGFGVIYIVMAGCVFCLTCRFIKSQKETRSQSQYPLSFIIRPGAYGSGSRAKRNEIMHDGNKRLEGGLSDGIRRNETGNGTGDKGH